MELAWSVFAAIPGTLPRPSWAVLCEGCTDVALICVVVAPVLLLLTSAHRGSSRRSASHVPGRHKHGDILAFASPLVTAVALEARWHCEPWVGAGVRFDTVVTRPVLNLHRGGSRQHCEHLRCSLHSVASVTNVFRGP